ncbi:MAG: hypothetical protein A2Y97_12810 [Nitrospirae bacterium RBG_13_39_12]|nr:MAG: hypothetical protein A2Y97_12810 [Nitrospirae bacterium RBG_13_39_12]
MRLATKEEIENFLHEFRRYWDGNIVPRRDARNENTLTELGLTIRQRAEEVRQLKYKDYSEGPFVDYGSENEEWWEFGKMVNNQEVYIKIKVYTSDSGARKGKCMSFHFPDEDKPIRYPYKTRRG